MFLVLIILCILTLIISYTKIYLRLRHHQIQLQGNQQQRGQPLPNRKEIPLNIARYKKTVSSIAWVQLALILCCLPFSVCLILLLNEALYLAGSVLEVTFFFSLLKFISEPDTLLLEDQGRERSSEGHN